MTRFSVGERVERFKEVVRTDTTTHRAVNLVSGCCPKLPRATAVYLANKVPIIWWLPHYHPSWLMQDFLAGLTIGVMLIPQGLAYAQIATIPMENGLYSSWIPALIGVVMGTSKGKSRSRYNNQVSRGWERGWEIETHILS